jgi:hypothetical protein
VNVNAEEYALGDLLAICRQRRGGFTLGEVVAAVLREKPGEVREFAKAWGELHERGLLRVRRAGRPTTYEVVAEGTVDTLLAQETRAIK